MKKAQEGISMNVIIVSAIALLVFVVLLAIFSGNIGIFDLDEYTPSCDCQDCTISSHNLTYNSIDCCYNSTYNNETNECVYFYQKSLVEIDETYRGTEQK